MIHLLQGATILEVFYKRGSTLFNEDVLDFHHIKEQLKQIVCIYKIKRQICGYLTTIYKGELI